MSNWIPITIDDLNDAKVSALVDAARSAALAEGQTDPAPRVIARVVSRIRAEIKGCATNKLDSDPTTIPEDLSDLAARMIVRRLQGRLNISLSDDEKTEQKDDLRYLERIAACSVPIAAPDNVQVVEEVQSLSGTPKIYRKRRFFTRRQGEGI